MLIHKCLLLNKTYECGNINILIRYFELILIVNVVIHICIYVLIFSTNNLLLNIVQIIANLINRGNKILIGYLKLIFML